MLIDKYKREIARLCEGHKVKTLYAFGSVLTDRFTDESDIDLMVDFEPISVEYYADNYFEFKWSLQELFRRKVDLLEEKALKNPFFLETVKNQRQVVYEH